MKITVEPWPDDAPREDVVLTAADHYVTAMYYMGSMPNTDTFHENFLENLLLANAHLAAAQLRVLAFEESLADVAGVAPDPDAGGNPVRVPPERWTTS